jgi:NAD-dependent SIR2 family protein deacetylase
MLFRSNSLLSILHDILNGEIKNVVVLTGAGVSVSSGIPDFRSADGLYKTLKPELLTATESQKASIRNNPTLVVDYDLFRVNQFPYVEVRRNLILGIAERKWKPTLGHAFMKVLNDKDLLLRVYTQNIDGIDYQLNLISKEDKENPVVKAPEETVVSDRKIESSSTNSTTVEGETYATEEEAQLMKEAYSKMSKPKKIAEVQTPTTGTKMILNVHGTLHEIECENCHDRSSFTLDSFCQEIQTKIKNIYDSSDPVAPKESSNILCPKCGKAQVKPATVMFGRSLPKDVFKYLEKDSKNIDLMIVIGTSLQVSPANFFVDRVDKNVPRLIINREKVGEEMGLDYGVISECRNEDLQEYLKTAAENPAVPQKRDSRDAILIGDCDDGILYLLQQLQWMSNVIPYQDKLCPSSKAALENVGTVEK